MQDIASAQNKNYKLWASLLDSKGVQTHQCAILAGKKVVLEHVQNHLDKVIAVLMPAKPVSGFPSKIDKFRLTSKLFDQLDVFGTGFPLLVVQVPEIKPWSKEVVLDGCSVLLTQQDPKNVGAILRSAAAFGVSHVLLGPGCAHPFHPQSTRAASGTVFQHHYLKVKDLTELKDLPTVALDMSGENIVDFVFPKSFVLVPGVEGPGLPKGFEPSRRITIKMSHGVESLNVMQATTIALYEWSKGAT